jgi:hypothetical protein
VAMRVSGVLDLLVGQLRGVSRVISPVKITRQKANQNQGEVLMGSSKPSPLPGLLVVRGAFGSK